MSDQFRTEPFQTDPFDTPPPPPVLRRPPALPAWLARRLLRPNEEITWVRGPRFNPEWERYVTHPALILVALAVAAVCVVAGRLSVSSWSELHPVPGLAAIGIVFGAIAVLAFFNGYFTRLVVTNFRLFIVQGYEVRSSWSIDAL